MTTRPSNVVTYFGDYASALVAGDRRVHIFMDGDELTFCHLPVEGLEYGTPVSVGQRSRVSCQQCFALCQKVRRDGD